MRTQVVLYPYAALYPEAVAALPENAIRTYTGHDPTAYSRAVGWIWGKQDLFVVEQDIVLPEDAVTQMEDCPHPWCVFPYAPAPDYLTCHGIPAMRVRQEAAAAAPWPRPHVRWQDVDGQHRALLTAAGYGHPHVHYPPAIHRHAGIPLPADGELDRLYLKLLTEGCRGYVEHITDHEAGGSDEGQA